MTYRQQAQMEPPYVVPTSQPPMPTPMPPSVAPVVPSALPTGQPLVVLPTSPVRGLETAPVTMHIMSDFQCPFCSRVVPTVHELMQTYEGRVRFVWHDYPLPFHQNAMPAAEAAQEVHRQLGDEAFWRFHDVLFENQSDLSRPSLERLASQLPGLDLARFRQALDTHEHELTIRSDMAMIEAVHSGGLGTPSFSIDGTWVAGAQPSEAFHSAIDAALVGH
jgi:protein-disulfide isomerase